MTQIIALLNDLLAACQGVRALLQTVFNLVQHTAQENVPFHITTQVDVIEAIVSDGTFGNAALKTAIDTLTSNQATEFGDIMAAIAGVQGSLDGGVTVIGVDPTVQTDQASQVWNFPVPTEGTFAYVHLAAAGNWSRYQSVFGHTTTSSSSFDTLWKLWGDFDTDGQADLTYDTTFALDLTTILASDATAYDWASRVYPDAGFFLSNQGFPAIADPGANTVFWYIDLDQMRWLQLKQVLGLTPAAILPPIWPGVAGVTLGSSVALAPGVTVTGPLSGVLIALTSVPADKAFFTFDGTLSYRNLGALTFTSDNGDNELPQPLGFTSALYLPKTMQSAAAVIVRTTGGVVGTITPFTIP